MIIQYSYVEDESWERVERDCCILNDIDFEYFCNYMNLVKFKDMYLMARVFINIDLDKEQLKTADDIVEIVNNYKSKVPVFVFVLMENYMIRYIIREFIVDDDIRIFYDYNAVYDISNSYTYKKMLLLQSFDVTLSDNKIKQMIEQGTELYNNNKMIRA